ncbi:hypothetical protein [Opitutus terrae]|uniref:Cyclase dehydrase n=1 Tax=Opitutus terrae (strain DSM 11246 / JCM 15787 / PB90-1) TaxID=452637 RepID=B1ZR01_OPITP|nr:hypothetical protein [Opitutus terrae]ACB73668.1 hypothetical protein Oter_0378 [Opitutus terrae PB90-1]
MNAHTLSRSLGFFSLGLGLAELLAPRKVAAVAGINDDHDTLIRSLGAREIASGLAILSGTRTKEAVWSRVLGDAIDLGLLAAALNSPRTDRRRLTGALGLVGAVTALDVFTSVRLQRGPQIDPSWRYTPARGRAGIDLAARGKRGSAMLQAASPAATDTPTGKPLELATEPQQAESA